MALKYYVSYYNFMILDVFGDQFLQPRSIQIDNKSQAKRRAAQERHSGDFEGDLGTNLGVLGVNLAPSWAILAAILAMPFLRCRQRAVRSAGGHSPGAVGGRPGRPKWPDQPSARQTV